MKKIYFVSATLFVTFLVAYIFSVLICGSNFAYGKNNIGAQCQQLIDALNVQASYRIATGDNAEVDADTQTVVSDTKLLSQKFASNNATYPNKFDLREADLGGSGKKNYVTSVKLQNPWGSCWAFAGTAASEISILSELRQNSYYVDQAGEKHDSLDLSEHHLSWFNYSPMQNFETFTQADEGAYSVTEEDAFKQGNPWALSQRMATGGVCMSTTSSYAMGMGVVKEPDFNDPNVSPAVRQLLYKGLNGYQTTTKRNWHIFSKDDDWSIDYSNRFLQDYKLEQGLILPDAKTPADQPYDIEHAKQVTKMMKEQLLSGHALNIAFKADQARPDTNPKDLKYLNPKTWAHYTWEPVGTSHDVTVVGWDDDYSVDNFLPEHKPPEKGAWIVKNSWGALNSWGQGLNKSDWGINESGYFYMSYYDKSLKAEEAYDYDVAGASASIDVTNQHDFMPCEAAKAIEQSAPVTTANVFSASVDQDLKELGAITSTENETVTYKLYKLNDKNQRIDTGELLWSSTENYTYKGFHRVRFGQSFRVNKGEVFAVTKTEQSGNKYLMGVTSDANRDGYNAGKAGDHYYCIGIVNPGESYLYTSSNDTWTDFSLVKKELESGTGDAKYYTYDNFPIKVFGTQVTQPSPVPPSPTPVPVVEASIDTYQAASTGDKTWVYISFALLALGLGAFFFWKS